MLLSISEDFSEGEDVRPKRAQIVKKHLGTIAKQSTASPLSVVSRSAAAPMQHHPLSGSSSDRSSSAALTPHGTTRGSQDKSASQRTTTPLPANGRFPAAPLQHMLSGRGRPRFAKALPGGDRSSGAYNPNPHGRPTHTQSGGGSQSTVATSHDMQGTNANRRIISPIPVTAGRSGTAPMQRPHPI